MKKKQKYCDVFHPIGLSPNLGDKLPTKITSSTFTLLLLVSMLLFMLFTVFTFAWLLLLLAALPPLLTVVWPSLVLEIFLSWFVFRIRPSVSLLLLGIISGRMTSCVIDPEVSLPPETISISWSLWGNKTTSQRIGWRTKTPPNLHLGGTAEHEDNNCHSGRHHPSTSDRVTQLSVQPKLPWWRELLTSERSPSSLNQGQGVGSVCCLCTISN